jgi:hypothetical protein
MQPCPIRKQLVEAAEQCLVRIRELTADQITALKAGDHAQVLAIDKDLETVFGDKEKAFGALQQHTAEHGC